MKAETIRRRVVRRQDGNSARGKVVENAQDDAHALVPAAGNARGMNQSASS